MNSLLIPRIEFILQLYTGLEFKETSLWDENIIYLYLSLLREFNGNSEFIELRTWESFVIGQELVLGKELDSNSSKNEFNLSFAFWSLKKRLVGFQEVEKLYLFSSGYLALYWVNLVGNLVLEDNHRKRNGEPDDFEKRDLQKVQKCFFRWKENFEHNTKERTGGFGQDDSLIEEDKGNIKQGFNSYGEKIEVSMDVFAMFIIVQFMFTGTNFSLDGFNRVVGMYSKECYINIIKYFQRNLSLILRLNSLFMKKNQLFESRDNLELYSLFFNNIPVKGDRESENIYTENDKVELTGFSVDYFNYHILPESSNEIMICILLNEDCRMINFRFLESFYIIKESNGTKSEKATYYLSEKIMNLSAEHNLFRHSNNGAECMKENDEALRNSSRDQNKPTLKTSLYWKEDIIYLDEICNIMAVNSGFLNLFITRPIDLLYLVDCNDCNVYCLNLIGNIKVDNCKGINIHTDCMSISLNQCLDCNLFIHSHFSPSIINSHNIHLGPYNIHCTNRKTSYLNSSESGLLTENWCSPKLFNSKFEIIEPRKLFILELVVLDELIESDNLNKVNNFPLPKLYQKNFSDRKLHLETLRNMKTSSRKELISNFIYWVCSKHVI